MVMQQHTGMNLIKIIEISKHKRMKNPKKFGRLDRYYIKLPLCGIRPRVSLSPAVRGDMLGVHKI